MGGDGKTTGQQSERNADMAVNEIKGNMDRFADSVVNVTHEVMHVTGSQFQNDARMNGNYKDHTGNLRASVGYGIKSDVGSVFAGNNKATQLLENLISRHRGPVLALVAGMTYAAYVEAYGFEVISNSVAKARDNYSNRIKRALKGLAK